MKKIFITGASSGLGYAIAREYAAQFMRQGVIIGLVARNIEALHKLSDELETTYNTTCVMYALDVRDHQSLKNAADDFITRFGSPNIVIANAGVSRGTLTQCQQDIAAFQALMDINVMGLVHTFSPFIASMQNNTKEQSQLVGIASVAGIRGLPGAGAYSASKAAAIAYLESLRVEMQTYKIPVTTVAPGYIRTPMTDINQYKMPFLMEPKAFARKFISAVEHKRRFIIIPWQMGWLARLMRFIPPILWDLAMRNAPHKERTKWDWL